MDDKNKAVISAIMQLSNNLHFKTVSEGVETDDQVEFIKNRAESMCRDIISLSRCRRKSLRDCWRRRGKVVLGCE